MAIVAAMERKLLTTQKFEMAAGHYVKHFNLQYMTLIVADQILKQQVKFGDFGYNIMAAILDCDICNI